MTYTVYKRKQEDSMIHAIDVFEAEDKSYAIDWAARYACEERKNRIVYGVSIQGKTIYETMREIQALAKGE